MLLQVAAIMLHPQDQAACGVSVAHMSAHIGNIAPSVEMENIGQLRVRAGATPSAQIVLYARLEHTRPLHALQQQIVSALRAPYVEMGNTSLPVVQAH